MSVIHILKTYTVENNHYSQQGVEQRNGQSTYTAVTTPWAVRTAG